MSFTAYGRAGSIASRRLAGLLVLMATFVFALAAGAQSVTVTNVFEQHYRSSPNLTAVPGPNCTGITKIPPGQYPSTFHLETTATLHHYDPNNPSNDYYVYVAHFENSNYGTAEVAIFKSTSPCGPFMLQTNLASGTAPSGTTDAGAPLTVDGGGYGFRPGGWEARDSTAYQDASTQTYNPDGSVAHYADGYIFAASDSHNTVATPSGATCGYANDSIAGFHLTQDYLGIDTTTSPGTNGANWIQPCQQREAPEMFKGGKFYYLITSQAAGWYPSQAAYGFSTNPLTGFPAVPYTLGNASTYGGQSSGVTLIQGTQATTVMLTFNHLGGDDSKNPAHAGSSYDTGSMYLPLLLDPNTGYATMPWSPSWTVDLQTGVLTLPNMPNLARSATASSTVATAAASGSTTYTPSNAIDGSYYTRWAGSATGNSAFTAAAPTGTALCPVTNAKSTTPCNPSLLVDLGTVQPVQEVDLSFYMAKGSEAYFTYKIAYSADNITWTTLDTSAFSPAANATASDIGAIPFVTPITYGFNSIPVNFSARYVALVETSVVQQNSSSPFYGPGAYEMAVIQSTAPAVPQPATVTVTSSSTSVPASSAFTVNVNVSGTGASTPSGYVQLSTNNFTSDTYPLLQGSSTINIPAGAVPGGDQTLTVTYRADPTSAPIYGIGYFTGNAPVHIDVPAAPSNLSAAPASPNAIGLTWSAVAGATGYTINRSTDNGTTYTQIASLSATSYTDSGLVNGQNYCYTVASVNASGTGAPSAPVCTAATANFPVTNVAVNQSGPGALTVSYTAVNGATGYVIKRSANGGAYSTVATPTTTSYTDTGLATDGTNFCYTVAASFSTGPAADSAPVCSTASTNFAPAGVQVTPWASGQLYITWTSSGGGGTYAVKRAVNGGAYAALGSSSIPTYTDTGLTNDTSTYCYVVDAVLNNVTSNDSTAVCSTPLSVFLPVNNYSFESPSVPLWSTTPTSISNNSWSYVGNGNNSGNNSGISALSGTWTNQNTPPIALGKQVGLLEGTGSVTQSIGGFTAGNIYTVTVAASQRQTSYQSGTNPFTIAVNGSSLGTLSPSQAVPYYRDYSASFTASSASNTLALAGTSSSTTAAVLIDNIRITSTGSTATQINVAPMTVSQGTAYAVLTATQTYSGAAPTGNLVFQVGSGDQVAGTCSSSNGTQTCSATYPTGSFPAGSISITVSYQGDSNYAAGYGSGTLTISSAGSGTAQLVSTAPLTRMSDGSYQATVTVRNNGTTTARSVTVGSLTVGSASASGAPAAAGDIPPGGSATLTLAVPSSAGASGTNTVERLNGTYTGGTFGASSRTRLP